MNSVLKEHSHLRKWGYRLEFPTRKNSMSKGLAV